MSREILLGILIIALQTAVGGVALTLGAKITRNSVILKEGIVIAFAAALCTLIPYAGVLAGWLVMLYLLGRWCGCEVWPSGILLSLIGFIFQYLLTWLIIIVIMSLAVLFGTPWEEEYITFVPKEIPWHSSICC